MPDAVRARMQKVNWKEWWEFFSDRDVKWTFGVMMFICWIIVLAILTFYNIINGASTPTDQETHQEDEP